MRWSNIYLTGVPGLGNTGKGGGNIQIIIAGNFSKLKKDTIFQIER